MHTLQRATQIDYLLYYAHCPFLFSHNRHKSFCIVLMIREKHLYTDVYNTYYLLNGAYSSLMKLYECIHIIMMCVPNMI